MLRPRPAPGAMPGLLLVISLNCQQDTTRQVSRASFYRRKAREVERSLLPEATPTERPLCCRRTSSNTKEDSLPLAAVFLPNILFFSISMHLY